jgi:hypothetical protein
MTATNDEFVHFFSVNNWMSVLVFCLSIRLAIWPTQQA